VINVNLILKHLGLLSMARLSLDVIDLFEN
jgi:hypothetical protein